MEELTIARASFTKDFARIILSFTDESIPVYGAPSSFILNKVKKMLKQDLYLADADLLVGSKFLYEGATLHEAGVEATYNKRKFTPKEDSIDFEKWTIVLDNDAVSAQVQNVINCRLMSDPVTTQSVVFAQSGISKLKSTDKPAKIDEKEAAKMV